MIAWEFIFWTSIFLMLHTYLLFPWILKVRSLGKKDNTVHFPENDLPNVTVIFSAFNEEDVIQGKIDSVFKSNYDMDKVSVLIGSDASTDETNNILKANKTKYPNLHLFIFTKRRGKPAVINELIDKTNDEFIIMTDANILFHPGAIKNLVKHFANEKIGAVGANIINDYVSKYDVSMPESTFVSREISMKHREGLIWGAAIGFFGGLYAIRKALYQPVPAGFAVDDFFITMNILRKEKQCIMETKAIGYENAHNKIDIEYRRKVRIANGNFKNAAYFSREIITPWTGKNFAYISHKVIRWAGPMLMLMILISNMFLLQSGLIYQYSIAFIAGICFASLIDYFLSKIGLHIVFLRFIRHFITMNIALLHGFINFIRGESYDVWQPTNRS
ncbi:MAG TPA: glycosyltransferase [Bacteroidales bacterium]|nr:glycosyltransferase [Bacteroidales bacterium]